MPGTTATVSSVPVILRSMGVLATRLSTREAPAPDIFQSSLDDRCLLWDEGTRSTKKGTRSTKKGTRSTEKDTRCLVARQNVPENWLLWLQFAYCPRRKTGQSCRP